MWVCQNAHPLSSYRVILSIAKDDTLIKNFYFDTVSLKVSFSKGNFLYLYPLK